MGVDKWQSLNPNIPILRGYSPNVADLQAHYKMLQDLLDIWWRELVYKYN